MVNLSEYKYYNRKKLYHNLIRITSLSAGKTKLFSDLNSFLLLLPQK
jgi:hypothetical protein